MDIEILALWAALAIWLSGLWVAMGQGILTNTSVEILWERPELWSDLRILTILGMALVESAAIYWFIVAYQIIWAEGMTAAKSIWAWCAVWFTAFGAWYWEWKLVSWALESLARAPEKKALIMQFMILFVALVESAAIYWLIIAQKIIS